MSECFGYCMMEIWYFMGFCAVIMVFNFFVVVWVWNVVLALMCGNFVIWKLLEKVFLMVLVCEVIFQCALVCFGDVLEGFLYVFHGGVGLGELFLVLLDVAIVSVIGFICMGWVVVLVVV